MLWIRQANMDFILASSLHNVEMPVVLAYDIACQYSVNFWNRAPTLPPDIQPKFSPNDMEFFVGIMHIYGHTTKCQGPWSGRYRQGNANTPGDNIEHAWRLLNVLSHSASRMTEGGRIDLLNTALALWNFEKLITLGEWS
jgi:hypothetical protein